MRLGILVVVPTLAMIAFAAYIAFDKSAEHDEASETRRIAEMIDAVSRVDEAIGNIVALDGHLLAASAVPHSGPEERQNNTEERSNNTEERQNNTEARHNNTANLQSDDLSLRLALDELDDVLSRYPGQWSQQLVAANGEVANLSLPESPTASALVGLATRATTVRDDLLEAAASEAASSSAANLDRRIPALFSLIRVRCAILTETVAVSSALQNGGWSPSLRSTYTEARALETSYLDRAELMLGDSAPAPTPALDAARRTIGLGESLPQISVRDWETAMNSWGSAINGSISSVSASVVDDASASERAAARSATLTLVTVIITFALALLVVLWVAISLIRRVGRLTNFAMEIESAGQPSPLNDTHSDELGELSRSLDSMATRISDAVSLAQLETAVLEMIAAGKPLAETLDAIGTLFSEPGNEPPHRILTGEFLALDWSAVVASDVAKTTRLVDTRSGETTELPDSTRGRLAQSLIALALRRAYGDEVLEERATLDELTGLLNRRAIIETVDVGLEVHGDGDEMGILYVDLDEFKEINDRYGHALGDEVLVIQARRIAALVESLGGDVGRLGGDEFLAVLPTIRGSDELMAIGERIVEALGQPIDTSVGTLSGAASVGGATSRFGVKADQLLHEADVALYEAKGEGKHLAVVSTPHLRRRTSELERLKTAVRSAITHDEFCVHYQPVWSVHDGEPSLRGFEALARWDRPGADLAGPAMFMGIAEELRLMAQLDALIFRRVCTELASWTARGIRDCIVSVNISPAWIERPDFVDQVATIIAETNCDPSRLVAELTEETVMTDIEASRLRLGQLGELGLRIAVDDFGQGHSSLAYLRDLPINELKADRRFIAGVDREPRLAAIVTTIRDLARALELRFVAEGVERKAEYDCLVEIGCDLVQGFWAGYPMTASEATNLVEWLQTGATFSDWRTQNPHLSLGPGATPQFGARRRMITDTEGTTVVALDGSPVTDASRSPRRSSSASTVGAPQPSAPADPSPLGELLPAFWTGANFR